MGNWNIPPNLWRGPGYSVLMPPGFSALPPDPMSGSTYAWPSGSWGPPNGPALVWLLPISPFQVQNLRQHYLNFDNPMVAAMNAQSLGLLNVLRIAPLRQTVLNGANALVREFDALSLNGQPVRMSAILLFGPQSTLQCIVGISLYRWVEFVGPTLQFVGNLQLDGTSASPGEVRSVIDRNDLNRVEMQVVNADRSVAPIMSMPTAVAGTPVFQIHVEAGGSIRFGDVQGTNVQIGNHNTSNSLSPQAPPVPSDTHAGNAAVPPPPHPKGDPDMSNFQIGSITNNSSNVQTGDGNTQNIYNGFSPEDREQALRLIEQLKQQVAAAPIPEPARKEITEQVVPAMQQAAGSPDPKLGLTKGLEHLNTNLKEVGTAGTSLAEIVKTAASIAGLIGTGIHVVAPFLAGLL